jgi:hypothetical protein
MRTINFKGYDFLFDKSDILIWILDEWDVIRRELQDELEKRFTNDELLDYIEWDCSLEHKKVYNNRFASWEEEFQYFTS